MRALAPPPFAVKPARVAAAQAADTGITQALFQKRGEIERGNDALFQAKYNDWQGWARRYARSISAASFNALVIADMCARCDIRIEERSGREWEPSSDTQFDGLIDRYRNPLQNPDELVRLHAWHYQVAGEMACVSRDAPDGRGGVEYGIYSMSALEWNKPDDKSVTVKLVPEGKVEKETAFVVPRAQVVRFWMPDHEWQAYAWSPMAAAITDLKRYDALAKYALKTADSAVAMAGLLWSAGEPHTEKANPDEDGSEPNDAGTARSKLEEAYYQFAAMRLSEQDDVVGVAPPWLHWDHEYGKPEFVKLGEPLDPNGIAYRTEALSDFARATPLPVTTVVGGGVGDANHWSEWLASAKMFDSGVAPTMDRITHQDLTSVFLRPILVLSGVDPEKVDDYRIGYDPSPVIVKPDNSANALNAWKMGLLDDTAALEAMGFTEGELLVDPDVKQWLLTVLSNGSAGNPGTPNATLTVPGAGKDANTTTQGPPSTKLTPVAASALTRSRIAAVLSDALTAID